MIKEDFLANCGSRNPALRAFYFNFRRAEETGEYLSKGKQVTTTDKTEQAFGRVRWDRCATRPTLGIRFRWCLWISSRRHRDSLSIRFTVNALAESSRWDMRGFAGRTELFKVRISISH